MLSPHSLRHTQQQQHLVGFFFFFFSWLFTFFLPCDDGLSMPLEDVEGGTKERGNGPTSGKKGRRRRRKKRKDSLYLSLACHSSARGALSLSLEPFFYVFPPQLLPERKKAFPFEPGRWEAAGQLLLLFCIFIIVLFLLSFLFINISSPSSSFFQSGCFQLRSLKLRPQIRNERLVPFFLIFLLSGRKIIKKRSRKVHFVEKFIKKRSPPQKFRLSYFSFLSSIKNTKNRKREKIMM